MTKFKVGDRVRIINYGSQLLVSKKELEVGGTPSFPVLTESADHKVFDMSPDIVGQVGIVRKADICQGRAKYALDGPRKTAWYNDDQLELIYNDYPL